MASPESPLIKARPRRTGNRRGFALVVTLSLIVLLALLAVGALSLASGMLRTSVAGEAESVARANARMALMLALGELQKGMGPDQRVSANGSILTDADGESTSAQPQWMGVWDSWRAGPGEPGGHQTLAHLPGFDESSLHPTYEPARADHFRAWLVSLRPDEAGNVDTAREVALNASVTPGVNSDAVQLVGHGTLGPDALELVDARLLGLHAEALNGAPEGRFGWWVGDESQKARVSSDSYETDGDPTLADRLFRKQVPGSMATRLVSGLEGASEEAQFAALPSLASLDLVDGADGRPSRGFHQITPYSFMVLADVREGGLKRDLSTLLERPINPGENTDDFMLYRFTDAAVDNNRQEWVPIHDLAAYYQLYDHARYLGTSESWRRGVSYHSDRIPNAMQIAQPELGGSGDRDRFLRQYSRAYKSSVPVKVQILVTMTAEPIQPEPTDPNANTHYIRLHMMPSVTLWNPTNLPLVMNPSNNLNFAQQMRFMSAGFNINWLKNNQELNPRRPLNLAYAAMGGLAASGRPGWSGAAGGRKATTFDMYFATPDYPIEFEPGEVRVFSYDRVRAGEEPFQFRKAQNDSFQPHQQAAPGWNPDVIFPMHNSIWGSGEHAHSAAGGTQFAIRDTDQIAIRISTDLEDGTNYALDSEWRGAAFSYMLIQNNHQSRSTNMWGYRNYPLLSRMGDGTSTREFNDGLLRRGFPQEVVTVNRSAQELINISENGGHWPLFQFALMAGTETSESSNGGSFGGRKFASRPFLHSSTISPPHIDGDDHDSFYNYGLGWWVEEVNSIFEANVQIDMDNRRGYFGGGNTPESGTTHVVQQEIPVVPPISLAALSHAHLGGFTLANEVPNLQDPVVSAVGVGGLFPFTLRAVGNSYAHPMLAPDQAFRTWQRQFHGSGQPRDATLADHSYLVNKALWDDFFFSSITPQSAAVPLFETATDRSRLEVARAFFFDGEPLPNRRLVPYLGGLDEQRLEQMFDQAQQFRDGLADRIAAHLMVEGPFNINSTSVDAWRVFLSSLKDKPVIYLDKDRAMAGGLQLDQAEAEGTPVGGLALGNAEPVTGSESDPSEPDQWLGTRVLTGQEIDELAEAIVRQVKLRGPFLSLSEFVNRRLDSSNRTLAVKGALQAALDDPEVSINAGFHDFARRFSSDEVSSMNPAFPEALEGPVAYGSAAYVDQADVLRNLSGQITPRGDTFVIRTYGDKLDAGGRVVARAWCEAVVQRVPDYIDPADEPHVGQAELQSDANRMFGRQLRVVSFRWLNPSEI